MTQPRNQPAAEREVATRSDGPPISLLVINQYYEPDIAATGVLLTQLCEGLAEQGFDIRVVTAQPSYTESSNPAPAFEVRNGVEVHRISLGGLRGRVSMRTRMTGYLRFLHGSKKLGSKLVHERRPDIVVTVSNPPLLERVGRTLSKKTGAPFVHVIHDIHPDVLLAGGQIKLPPLTARAWASLSARALRHADRLIVLSANMKRNLVETKGIEAGRVDVINLWAVPEVSDLPDPEGVRANFGLPQDHLLITHTGNMGIIHGLESVLDAAALLRDAPVTFLFVGDGAMKAALEARAARSRLTNTRFLPYQSRDDYLRLVSASDASLVSLRAGMEKYSLPSKTFTSLAAGKPIIGFVQPGNDVSEILAANSVGWSASTIEELAALVKRLCCNREEVAEMGSNARELYTSRFAREKAIAEYKELFERMNRQA